MTTAAAAKLKPSTPLVLREGKIAIALIETAAQVRKEFGGRRGAIAELTDSVRKHGVISPLTLRPAANASRFLLVCGERRLRAAKDAGLTEVPARVLQLTPEEAALFQIEENIQRKDLTPLEEARGLRALMDSGKRSAEELASVVSKSVAYVTRAVRLLELPKEVLDAIEADEATPAHGHQLLRVPLGQRLDVWKVWQVAYGENGNARSLQDHVDSEVGCSLERAPFPRDRAYAGEVACSACPSNSENQGALFDGAVRGRCLNRTCFAKKARQAQADDVAKLRKAYPAAADVAVASRQLYVGSPVRTDDGRAWVARSPFEKKVPKGKFALFATPGGEVWLAEPAPEPKKEVAAKPAASVPKVDEKAQKEREERVWQALKKAPVAKLAKIYAKDVDQGWQREWLRKRGIKSGDVVRAAVALHFNLGGVDALAKGLGVK